MDLSDLIRIGKQYLSDAMPGGSLNPEVSRQSVFEGATGVKLGDLINRFE